MRLSCVPGLGHEEFRINLNLPAVLLGSRLPGVSRKGSVVGHGVGFVYQPFSISLAISESNSLLFRIALIWCGDATEVGGVVSEWSSNPCRNAPCMSLSGHPISLACSRSAVALKPQDMSSVILGSSTSILLCFFISVQPCDISFLALSSYSAGLIRSSLPGLPKCNLTLFPVLTFSSRLDFCRKSSRRCMAAWFIHFGPSRAAACLVVSSGALGSSWASLFTSQPSSWNLL